MEFMSKQRRDQLLEEIAKLRGDIKALQQERKAVSEQLGLTEQIADLKKKISDLKADESRITEKHARGMREVEHQVGLQRKRQDFEVEAAKRDTKLSVREGNLEAERERFNRDMEFQRDELKSQIGYLKDLMEKLFDRLPSMSFEGTLVGAGNGKRRRAAE